MPHFEELYAQVNDETPASGVTWGDITGTLSDQADLQAALDAKLDDSQASAFGLTLLAAANAAAAQVLLALVPGTNVQAWDADLDALAGLSTAADSLPYFTGVHTAALTTLTTFGRSLIDDADASTARATLGLVIGTDVQAQDAELQAIAGLTSAADRVPYFTGSGTAALATFTAGGRALVDSAGTANTFPYFSASNTVTLGAITAAGRALIDDADAAAQRTTLGLVIGTNVQAWDAELQALAGLVSAADQLPYFTGSGTAALTTLTSFSRTLLDDTTAGAAATTLGLGTGDSPTFAGLTITGLSAPTQLANNGALQATKSGNSAITPNWQMNGTTAATSSEGLARWANDANASSFILSKSRGAAIGTHAAVADGDLLGRLVFTGSDGAAFFEGARIQAFASGTPGTGAVSGALGLMTTPVGGGQAVIALTLNNDQSASFAAHVNAPTTMVVGNTAAIPANTRVLIDRLGTGTLPTLPGGTALTLQGNNAASNNNYLVNIAGASGQAGIRFGDSGAASQGRIDYDNATDSFGFYTNGTLALTLTSAQALQAAGALSASSGAFNTGTLRAFASSGSSITPVLQVNGTSIATSSQGMARWATTAGPATLVLGYSANASVGSHTVVADTNVLGRISFNGSDGTAFVEAARIEAAVNGTPGTNDMPGSLKFYTTPDGSATPGLALTLAQDTLATFAGSLSIGGGISGSNIYGTYTPTLTGVTNVSATTANLSGWIRIGNAVLVFTRVQVTATASGVLTEVRCSLPVASNFGNVNQCVGAGGISSTTTEVGVVGVQADTTNDEALMRFVATNTGARQYTVIFGYIVI